MEAKTQHTFKKFHKGWDWLKDDGFRPYVLMRKPNLVKDPWKHFQLKEFCDKVLYVDPLRVDNVSFIDAILKMEKSAFHFSDMYMERWVFYDCNIMPGLSCGFSCHRDLMTDAMKKAVGEKVFEKMKGDWVPLSLFAIVPCAKHGDWVANNLSSVNPALPKSERFSGMGFLSKAFGLAYANIENCYGMTQWDSSTVALHSYYGIFNILTAYTPAHTYPQTLTYRVKVKPEKWEKFFTGEETKDALSVKKHTSFELDIRQLEELISFQKKLEAKNFSFFLDSYEARHRKLSQPVIIYQEAE